MAISDRVRVRDGDKMGFFATRIVDLHNLNFYDHFDQDKKTWKTAKL